MTEQELRDRIAALIMEAIESGINPETVIGQLRHLANLTEQTIDRPED